MAHPSGSKQSAALCAQGRRSTMSGTRVRISGSAIQVRAGRLELGAVHTAHANPQSVCSADPAHWAGPWYTLSPGLVRRAARRPDVHIMFIVRIGFGSTRREASASYLMSNVRARPWALPPDAVRGLYAHTSCAIRGWSRGHRRRSDEAVSRADTAEGRRGQKVGVGMLSVSDRKHGIRQLESLWFEAAIGDPQAVAWGPARPPT